LADRRHAVELTDPHGVVHGRAGGPHPADAGELGRGRLGPGAVTVLRIPHVLRGAVEQDRLDRQVVRRDPGIPRALDQQGGHARHVRRREAGPVAHSGVVINVIAIIEGQRAVEDVAVGRGPAVPVDVDDMAIRARWVAVIWGEVEYQVAGGGEAAVTIAVPNAQRADRIGRGGIVVRGELNAIGV